MQLPSAYPFFVIEFSLEFGQKKHQNPCKTRQPGNNSMTKPTKNMTIWALGAYTSIKTYAKHNKLTQEAFAPRAILANNNFTHE